MHTVLLYFWTYYSLSITVHENARIRMIYTYYYHSSENHKNPAKHIQNLLLFNFYCMHDVFPKKFTQCYF